MGTAAAAAAAAAVAATAVAAMSAAAATQAAAGQAAVASAAGEPGEDRHQQAAMARPGLGEGAAREALPAAVHQAARRQAVARTLVLLLTAQWLTCRASSRLSLAAQCWTSALVAQVPQQRQQQQPSAW